MRPPAHSVELTQVTEWKEGTAHSFQDTLAAEEPLEIRVDETPLTVTMRTPGNDLELAAGFLWTEGILESHDQIASIRPAAPGSAARNNTVEVQFKGVQFTSEALQRNFFAASSCGICGKASIEAIRHRGRLLRRFPLPSQRFLVAEMETLAPPNASTIRRPSSNVNNRL